MRSGLRQIKLRDLVRKTGAFTLVELLTASVVFMIVLGLTLIVTNNLSRMTTENTSSVTAFQEARTAFETMNRMLSQAVLNSYWDYDNPASPRSYIRASELHFISGESYGLTGLDNTVGHGVFGFAPLSIAATPAYRAQPDLLNALGFFVRYSALPDVPDFPSLARRRQETGAWRLWMYLQPSEQLSAYTLYSGAPQAPSDLSWFRADLGTQAPPEDGEPAPLPRNVHVLGNNVVLLLIRAGYTNSDGAWVESYAYNSRGTTPTTSFPQRVEIHQMPPVLSVTLVAIDQKSANRLFAINEGGRYDLIPQTLFQNTDRYKEDIQALHDHLSSGVVGIPVQYRVFETAINVTSSKWSQ